MGTTNTTSAGGAAVADPQRPFEATEVGVGIAIALPAALLRRRGLVVTATLMSKAAPVYPLEKRNFRINIITATVTVNAYSNGPGLALGPWCYQHALAMMPGSADAAAKPGVPSWPRHGVSSVSPISGPGQLPLTQVWVL